MNSRNIFTLLDTGAFQPFISRSCLEKLLIDKLYILKPCREICLSSASSSKMLPLEQITLDLNLRKLKLKHLHGM